MSTAIENHKSAKTSRSYAIRVLFGRDICQSGGSACCVSLHTLTARRKMAHVAVNDVFHALRIDDEEDFFHPRRGSERSRGSETADFYVVTEGRQMRIVRFLGIQIALTKSTGAGPQPRVPGMTRFALAFPLSPRQLYRHHPRARLRPRTMPVTSLAPGSSRAENSSAPSTPTGRRLLYVYSHGDNTTIYADEQQASSAARHGLEDGSFRKVEVTPRVRDAFDHARESAEVIDISDFSESE
ncbi:hypothetical protein C8R45DRAFT_947905 [Mycena sanguinolenta]|nr:hypothetical protein C8R45DRAFT_947905 [Mycena sanguinolenta]